MFFVAASLVIVLDSTPKFLAVFDIVRNQYFYLGEDIVATIPLAAIEMVCGFLIIETVETGSEGMGFALLTSFTVLSQPFGTAVSEQIFGFIQPSLSDIQNYAQDSPSFRTTVASSYLLQYGTTLAACLLLPLIPGQKEEAQRRKQEWHSRKSYAIVAMTSFTMIFMYSIAVLALSLMPESA
mmetsp:Transcript_101362/g.180184  ORF Transcript_101362/g.180184 Transcript_101362/m.180184 type:complete len:182 (+) Transcript_101362:1110-1655(+)